MWIIGAEKWTECAQKRRYAARINGNLGHSIVGHGRLGGERKRNLGETRRTEKKGGNGKHGCLTSSKLDGKDTFLFFVASLTVRLRTV